MAKKILLIDDDADDRAMFCEAVDEVKPGIECESAANGSVALSILENQETDIPDIIFMDINMPGNNGWEYLKKIKTSRKCRNIPVIMYSTSSSDSDIKKTEEYGALGLFTKPGDFEELTDRLKTILSHLENNTLHAIAGEDYHWFATVDA